MNSNIAFSIFGVNLTFLRVSKQYGQAKLQAKVVKIDILRVSSVYLLNQYSSFIIFNSSISDSRIIPFSISISTSFGLNDSTNDFISSFSIMSINFCSNNSNDKVLVLKTIYSSLSFTILLYFENFKLINHTSSKSQP